MAIVNAGFEDAGVNPGEADGWSDVVTSSAEEIAEFGPDSPGTPHEGLEAGWDSNGSYLFDLASASLEDAFFDASGVEPEAFEDFEELWDSNESYSEDLSSSSSASFDANPEAFEDFEEEWDSNQDYDTSLGSNDAAGFDPGGSEDVEDFEEEWDNNATYLSSWPGGTAAIFEFGFASQANVEDFEEVFDEITISVDASTDVFTSIGHGLSDGDIVLLRNDGGALPAGLNTDTEYYVTSSTADTFKLARESGGAAIDVDDVGTGTHFLRGNPDRYWPDSELNV